MCDQIFLSVKLTLILIMISLPLSANSSGQEVQNNAESNIVAKVGIIIITADEFYNSYEFGPAFVKRTPNSKEKYLNYMINEKLLALKGYNEGLDTNAQAREFHDAILSDLATEELFKDLILQNIEVSQSEIDTVVNMKKLQLDLSWLYSVDESGISKYWKMLEAGIAFDSLVQSQLSDSVFLDMRTMKTNRYQLGKKNPLLTRIVDTLKLGSYSLPIHTDDGWYIIKLNNAWQNIITSESETNKLEFESKEAVIKQKMDAASDEYVNSLLLAANPIIKRNVFNILRSYLGQFVLPKDKYNGWELAKSIDDALNMNNDAGEKDINELPLIQDMNGETTLAEFLIWYRSRSQYIKFNKSDLTSYSRSLEQLVWRMLRDKLLFEIANEHGYTEMKTVVEQSNWWKDKICFSTMLNQLKNSVEIKYGEVTNSESNESSETELQKIEMELSAKLYREVQKLKKKYNVEIYNDVLSQINVSTENDPKAIELYTVKKGGLIPRTPYPSIDMIWKLWE